MRRGLGTAALVAALVATWLPQPAASAVPALAAGKTQPAPDQVTPYQIQRIQEMLRSLGYDPGPADGVPGARTISAVAAFQQRFGLPQTGKLDLPLYRALAERSNPAAGGPDSTPSAQKQLSLEPGAAAPGNPDQPANPIQVNGTRWEIVDDTGSRLTLRFISGGTLAEVVPAQFWKWRVNGTEIEIEFNNGIGGWVRRSGRMTADGTIAGTAISSRRKTWKWTAHPVK